MKASTSSPGLHRALCLLAATAFFAAALIRPIQAATFANGNSISIPNSGAATPYPSTIAVTGLTGEITRVTVTLSNLSHNFPDDLDVLLVGPHGQNVLLLSDAGGSTPVTGVDLSFGDNARSFLTDSGQLVSGFFQPANFDTNTDVFPVPAPGAPYGSELSGFIGTDPAGAWRLYVRDDMTGDTGFIANGWRLNLFATNYPPVITQQPQSQTVAAGATVTFSVMATGTATLVYQWRKNGSIIAGAFGSSYSKPNVQPADAGSYTVDVANSAGAVTSAAAVLTLGVPPSISVQPQGSSVPAGSDVTLSVTAGGTAPLRYRWQFNGADLPGTTNAALNIAAVQPLHSGPYRVIVTNAFGTVTSAIASLSVALIPTGTVWKYLDAGTDQGSAWREPAFDDSAWASGPAQLGYGDGDEATMVNSGPPGLHFITTYFRSMFVVSGASLYTNLVVRLLRDDGAVVYLNGVEVVRDNMPPGDITFSTRASTAAIAPGQNSFFTFAVSPLLLREGLNILAVEVHQNAPTSSDLGFDLELIGGALDLPVFRIQPQSRMVSSNTPSITFTSSVAGTGPFTYEWRWNGTPVPHGTNSSLTVSNVQVTNGGCYRVIVRGPNGDMVSEPASLIVNVPTSPAPSNTFASRPALASGGGMVRGTNAPADKEPGEPAHGGQLGGRSVWYTWQAPSNGIATFSLQGSCFDTLVAVYVGTSVDNLTWIADDDDAGGNLTSLVQFNAKRGTNYQIAIDGAGRGGSSGPFVLSWTLEVTGDTIPAITMHPTSQGALFGSNATFSVAYAGLPANYQWFFDDAPIPGATGPSYTVTNAQGLNSGMYSVQLSNGLGRVIRSQAGSLDVGSIQNFLCKGPYTPAGRVLKPLGFDLRKQFFQPADTGLPSVAGLPIFGGEELLGFTTPAYGGADPFTVCNTALSAHCFCPPVTNMDGLRLEMDTVGSMRKNGQEVFTTMAVYNNNPGWETGQGNSYLIPFGCDTRSAIAYRQSAVCLPPSAVNTVYNAVLGAVCPPTDPTCESPKLAFNVRTRPRLVFQNENTPLVLKIGNRLGAGYHWLQNGVTRSVTTAPMYMDTSLSCADAGTYSVAITNIGPVKTFDVAIVTVSPLTTQTEMEKRKARLFYEVLDRTANPDLRLIAIGAQPFLVEAGTMLPRTPGGNWTPLPLGTNLNPNCPLVLDLPNIQPFFSVPTRRFFRIVPIPSTGVASTPPPFIPCPGP